MKYNKFLLFGILFLFFSIYAYAQNTKPTADAGADRNVIVGQDATLFGSGTDDDGDDITFEWRLIEGPGGSLSELLRDDVQNPTFIPDKVGDYKFSLRTNDGTEFSDSSHVIITANDADPDNTKPISYAGPDRNVNIREETALAGSGSDADGESLLYMWTLLSSPTDSKIQLSVLNKPTLSFTPGLVGEYTFNLTVNDGKEDSDPDKVKVTASTPDTNRAPSADAGLPKTIRVGEETTLSGTGSDPDNDPLAFTWAISKPLGSIDIMPSNNDIPNLTFTPDVEGAYTFSLFVDDGQENSETSTVIYTAQTPETNNKPIADSGFDRNVNAGEQVELQGSGSDQNQDTLTFRWSIVKMP